MDVDMPLMDGLEFTLKIRSGEIPELRPFKDTPIILITGVNDLNIRERGFKAGVNEFIAKPFRPEELQHIVNRILHPEGVYRELNVLAVDDSATVRSMVRSCLRETGVHLQLAEDGAVALKIIQQNPEKIDLVLTDFEMPIMNGLQLCTQARLVFKDPDVPIIFLTSITERQEILKTFAAGATDYLLKPFTKEELLARLNVHLKQRWQNKEKQQERWILESKLFERTQTLLKTQEATIQVIANLVEHRDPETGNHIIRTQNYVRLLGKALMDSKKYKQQTDAEWLDNLTKSAPLHDIGKIAVPDHILLKPGKLTPEEFAAIKLHAAAGRDALLQAKKHLGESNFLAMAADMAGSHHEKWDGSGYPQGLKEHNIPLVGRIMAVADVYDALISKRVYKAAMPHAEAVDFIEANAASHFDPFLVRLFIQHQTEIREIKNAHSDP